MFDNVLVPVDLTDRTLAAVAAAARLVQTGGRVTLFHVVQKVPGLDLDADPEFYERLEKAASRHLAALRKQLDDEGVACEATIVVGNRGDEILAAAEDGIDLLVLSSHRVDFRSPETGASTMSYRLAVATPCAVLLLK